MARKFVFTIRKKASFIILYDSRAYDIDSGVAVTGFF